MIKLAMNVLINRQTVTVDVLPLLSTDICCNNNFPRKIIFLSLTFPELASTAVHAIFVTDIFNLLWRSWRHDGVLLTWIFSWRGRQWTEAITQHLKQRVEDTGNQGDNAREWTTSPLHYSTRQVPTSLADQITAICHDPDRAICLTTAVTDVNDFIKLDIYIYSTIYLYCRVCWI